MNYFDTFARLMLLNHAMFSLKICDVHLIKKHFDPEGVEPPFLRKNLVSCWNIAQRRNLAICSLVYVGINICTTILNSMDLEVPTGTYFSRFAVSLADHGREVQKARPTMLAQRVFRNGSSLEEKSTNSSST